MSRKVIFIVIIFLVVVLGGLFLLQQKRQSAFAPSADTSWPPQWYGAQNSACQWHHRALARNPQTWLPGQGRGYGEDSNVSYFHWGYPVGLPEGTKILIEGDFPHSRFMDFQVSPPWDPNNSAWRGGRGAPLIPLLDEDIEPAPGHVNPFRQGADRDAKNRHYYVEFELRSGKAVTLNPQAAVPPYRAPGNKRIGGHPSGKNGELGPYIELRIYAPDNYDPYGGVDLPIVTIQRPGEEPRLSPPVRDIYFRDNLNPKEWVIPYVPEDNPCLENGWTVKDREQDRLRANFVKRELIKAPLAGTLDSRAVSRRFSTGELLQLKAFGIDHFSCTLFYLVQGKTEEARGVCPQKDLKEFNRGPHQPPPGNDEHTNGWNMYNSFLFSFASLKPGEVLVFQGRAPDTPYTINGEPIMKASSQLRYWSLCLMVGAPAVTTVDCVMDENVIRDRSGKYTIVLSTEKDRPVNATKECGITWLPWRAGGEAITWRFMSTNKDTWQHALQRVSWKQGDYAQPTFNQDAVKNIMDEYYPKGGYQTKAIIEALGCPAS